MHLLFQPFTQMHRKHGFTGTGLGLALSCQLVTLMAGDIEVSSVEGTGSEFWFNIPVGIAPESRRMTDTSAHAEPALLAEDNPVNQRVTTKQLEKRGMRVTLAVDGAEALAMAQSGDFDLILMDNLMPILTGAEATIALRAKGIDTPIIAFTAGAMDFEIRRCLDAGMNDILTKPIQISALEALLKRYSQTAAVL